MAPRSIQIVSTKTQRRDVIEWMMAEVEKFGSSSRIAAKAANAVPRIFFNRLNCTRVRRTQREKAQSWWNGRVACTSKLKSELN